MALTKKQKRRLKWVLAGGIGVGVIAVGLFFFRRRIVSVFSHGADGTRLRAQHEGWMTKGQAENVLAQIAASFADSPVTGTIATGGYIEHVYTGTGDALVEVGGSGAESALMVLEASEVLEQAHALQLPALAAG